jgi:hypothetical protein
MKMMPSGQGQGQPQEERRPFGSPRPSADDDFVPEMEDDVPM